jgi:bifunctional enzyme CysN/CysC/sulfate adenylyltransferase subunit 1
MDAALTNTLDIQQFLDAHSQKELLRLAVVGSVDDGKSTLIGRLLYECNGLFDDQVASVRRASAKRAEALAKGLQAAAGADPEEGIDFSLFTDGLRAEREQGITIDVAYRYFSTAKRKIIVADTPGHLQYTRNMATGASTADAAVILIDARLGVLAQTRRHAYIASLLGIPYLAVAINKMDMVGFDQAVFERIGAELQEFARTLGFEQVRLFPVSASKGDNVARASANTPWHMGGTLLGWLESLPHGRRLEQAPLRFPVQTVLRPHQDYRGLAGQVASGTVRVGDEVVVLPSGRKAKVASIDTFDGSIPEASSPASVAVQLDMDVDVSRGDILAHPGQAPSVLHQVEAMLVWFGEKPLDTGHRYLIKHTSRYVPAHVEAVLWRKELEDLSEVPAHTLALNDIGKVRVVCKRPLLCDPYRDNRHTGAFVVVDPLTNDTVGAGMIVGPAGADAARSREAASLISAEERRARLGQTGDVLLLPDVADVEERALKLERRLFDAGRLVAAVRGDAEAALALAGAGLVAVLYAPGAQARRALREQLRGAEVRWVELEPAEDVETWAAQAQARQEVRS